MPDVHAEKAQKAIEMDIPTRITTYVDSFVINFWFNQFEAMRFFFSEAVPTEKNFEGVTYINREVDADGTVFEIDYKWEVALKIFEKYKDAILNNPHVKEGEKWHWSM